MPSTTDTWLVSTATCLPPPVSAEDAVARGIFNRKSFRRCEIEAVRVAGEESAPEMAATAAAEALTGIDPGRIELLLHANMYYQGREMWPAASYVQRVAVGNRCAAIDVRQMSNGGMAALHLAKSFVDGRSDETLALVTTGDKFCEPGFDRWNTDPGTVYADGGTAAVVSNRPGFAKILSLAMVSDSSLEQMHRGTDPFETAASVSPQPISLELRKDQFVDTVGMQFAIDRVDRGQDEVIDQALSEAGIKLSEIDWFVLPAFGRRRLDLGLFRKLGVDPGRTTWPWARQVGHLGAGDQIAGLHHLVTSGQAVPGQTCLLIGTGAGFSWSCAAVEIHRP
ncbi:3-oxoacyl-[acyl-carrier-protein] synthase-3 [Amycolatopsis xylanica]|uniref:3-oxoacyl-[acyl-carrier-protein] synthase-3 n=1 Tax=Amycolatopsis xylanica TaxID=589385 RepID=A0A1H3PHE9_9PSEU|nr:ketoacyl-ACP synthase III family protein [Amycolatopsis xylanica]SDZ00373.1 3-oxoacyl-[acyl-carrier-protein] synthase-3 [Amycolatopsis xylanica]